jgi:hypothetical protein
MNVLTFFLLQHARFHCADVADKDSLAERILNKVTDDQMRFRPAKGLNSVAWLLWHMARTEDVAVNLVVTDGRQVLDDGWTTRLNVPRRDIGTGMTENEVADLTARVDLVAVRAYRDAVGRRTREVAAALPATAWDEAVGSGDLRRAQQQGAFGAVAELIAQEWQDKPRAVRLGATAVGHNAMHLGEAVTILSQAGPQTGR